MKNNKSKFYTKEKLIEVLKNKAKKLRRIPKASDMTKPSHTTYVRFFGSWKNALEITFGEKEDKENINLLEEIKNKGKQLNRRPKKTDFDSCIYSKILKKYGNFESALKLAGFNDIYKKYTDEEIIEMYKSLYKKLGRTPSEADIDNAYLNGEICSFDTIYRRFNKLSNLQNMLGYAPCVEKKIKYTKESILTILKKEFDYHGERLNRLETHKKIGASLSRAYKIVGVHSFNELWEKAENYNIKKY